METINNCGCGGNASIVVKSSFDYGCYDIHIKCNYCGTRTTDITTSLFKKHLTIDEVKSKVISLWNTAMNKTNIKEG